MIGLFRRHRRSPARVMVAAALVATMVTALLVATGGSAYAAEPDAVLLAVDSVQTVVNRLRLWLVGILAAVATLFLTVGGLRYVAANGDPGEVEKAKSALRSAAIGYALALLAPLFVTIVAGFVA